LLKTTGAFISAAMVLCAAGMASSHAHAAGAEASAKSARKPLFSSAASESLKMEFDPETSGTVFNQVMVNYHYLAGTRPGSRDLVARETITTQYSDALEGRESTGVVELFYRRPDGVFPNAVDNATTVTGGDELFFDFDHWTAKTWGCCDAEPFFRLYSFGQHTPFLYSHNQYAKIEVPNAELERYVGVVLKGQVPTEEQTRTIFGNHERAMAAIIYGAPGMPMQKILLEPRPGTPEQDFPYHTEPVKIKSAAKQDEYGYNDDRNVASVLTMWSLDPYQTKKKSSAISGVTIVATFVGEKNQSVAVTINNDKFGAVKTSGVLRVVGAEKTSREVSRSED